eukprot:8740571-Pyramimonas_sp.AAC.1
MGAIFTRHVPTRQGGITCANGRCSVVGVDTCLQDQENAFSAAKNFLQFYDTRMLHSLQHSDVVSSDEA